MVLEELPSVGTDPPDAPASPARFLFAAVLIALLVRAAVAPFIPFILYKDAIYFDFVSVERFAAGQFTDGFLHWVPPLFPLLLVLPFKILDDLEFAGRATGAVLGALTVWPVYRAAHLYGGERVARIAAILIAVLPFHVRWSVRVSSHGHYAFFFALALWAGFALMRAPGRRRAAVFALAAGAAYWVRQEALGLVLVTAAALALPTLLPPLRRALWRGGAGFEFRRVLPAIAVLLALFGAYVYPIVHATHERTGRWVLSSKGGVSVFGKGRTLTELTEERTRILWETQITTMEDYQRLSVLGLVREAPGESLRSWGGNLYEHCVENLPRILSYLLVPFLLLGLAYRRYAPRGRVLDGYGVAVLGFYLAALSIFYDSDRLLLAMTPLCCIWAAAGLCELSGLIESWKGPGLARGAVAGTLLVLAAFNVGTVAKWDYHWGPSPEERAGGWILERYGAGRRIMDPSANVAFYGRGVAEFFPLGAEEDLLYFARHRAVEFIAFSAASVRRSHPELRGRLEGDAVLPGSERVYITPGASPSTAVHVFRLSPP